MITTNLTRHNNDEEVAEIFAVTPVFLVVEVKKDFNFNWGLFILCSLMMFVSLDCREKIALWITQ